MAVRRKSAMLRGRNLTSKQAARVLGVSEASIKRWADSGLLPMEKTAGGHRRFRPEDISAMRRERVQTTPSDNGHDSEGVRGAVARSTNVATGGVLSTENQDALVEETFQILIGGRTDELRRLLVNLHLSGLSVASIADRVLSPAMRRIGDLWHRGQLSIAVEHLATRAALEGVASLRSVVGPVENQNSLALCCSTEEDFHEFPVQVAAAVLEEQGFEVVELGPSMPFFALNDVVELFQPRLICVAATTNLINLDRTVRDYAEFRKQARRVGSAIVLGGAGFQSKEIRERLAADLHAENFAQLEKFVRPIIKEVESERKS